MAATETVTIPQRFNGPLDSANGGYACGIVAGFLSGAAEVSLRRPVPLDRPLEIRHEDDGRVLALDGDAVAVEAQPAPALKLDVPAPVNVTEARAARAGYRGPATGVFSSCFVCAQAREDALGVEAGPVEGRGLVATPWTPPEWTTDGSQAVRPKFIWAVLDCPTYFAANLHVPDPLAPAFLARFAVRIDAPVRAGEEHVVIGWPIETDGRKLFAGAALLSSEGEVLAVAKALMIEPRNG